MRTDKRAFTLVEIAIATAIMGLIMIGIYSFFTSSRKTQSELFSKSGVVQEAQKFFKQFHNDVFQAREILFPSHPEALQRTNLYFVFRDNEDQVIMYYLDTEKNIVYRKNLTKNSKENKIAENVSDLVFKKTLNAEKYGDLHYITVTIGFFQNSKNNAIKKYKKFFFTSIHLNKQTTDFYTENGPLNRDRILQEFY